MTKTFKIVFLLIFFFIVIFFPKYKVVYADSCCPTICTPYNPSDCFLDGDVCRSIGLGCTRSCAGASCNLVTNQCNPGGSCYDDYCFGGAGCIVNMSCCVPSGSTPTPPGPTPPPPCNWGTFSCDIVNCPTWRRLYSSTCNNCGFSPGDNFSIEAQVDATNCQAQIASGTTVNYRFVSGGLNYGGCVRNVKISWGDGTPDTTILSPSGGDRCLTIGNNDTFNFTHTYVNNTNTNITYQAHVSAETYQENDLNCKVGHWYDNVFCLNRTISAPKGTITGRVVNKANNAYLKSSAVCTTGTMVSGLAIDFGGGITTIVNQCNPDPYYTKSLNAGNYNISAVLPSGWEGVGYFCQSKVNDINGGTSCPGNVAYVNSPTGGGTISNVPLKANEAAHIWFYIRPIPPTCTISGSSKVPLGSNWLGSVTATVPGAATAPVSVEGAFSSTLNLGTRLGFLNGTGAVTTTVSWTPTDTNVGNTYNFYCRGNNGLDWANPIRQCRPFSYGAYPADVDCFNGTKNSTCLGTGTDCIPVEVTDTNAWFQVQGGDTHGQLGVTSYVPATATNPLFNLDLNTYPGLISYSPPNTYDFSADILSDGVNYSSSKKWLAQSGFSSSITNFYTHYLGKMRNNIDPSVFDCSGTHNFNNQGIKVYSVTGDCAVGNNWNVSGTSKIVVLVSGNLTLSGNSTTISVDTGSFLSFIVQGNMTVDDNLGNKQLANNPFIQGVYLVNGTIITGTAANMSGNRFIGGGIFYGKTGFNLGRDLKPNGCSGHACNSYTPAELFIFRPDLVVNAPYEIWSSKIDWQEVVP